MIRKKTLKALGILLKYVLGMVCAVGVMIFLLIHMPAWAWMTVIGLGLFGYAWKEVYDYMD